MKFSIQIRAVLIGISFPWCACFGDDRPNVLLILADDLGYSDLGCYGGEIRTPHLNALAGNGLRMTQLYNAARCCSTRASLLTGLYPHQAGVGAMSADHQLPGYRGFLTSRCVTIATLLKQAGYRTCLSGKWHLRGAGNPACLPTSHGFDEFYGHFRAYASYYRPELYVHMPARVPPRRPAGDRFYATNAITDHAIQFIQRGNQEHGGTPFFLYLAFNAPHFPLQAPRPEIESYVATYEAGWDHIRESRYRKMRELGIVPGNFRLSPRGHVTKVPERNRDSLYYGRQIPSWDGLSMDRRRDLTRRMATYAAMVEIMDRNIGRVVEVLRDLDQLDNTLILFLSDNGACAEWDPMGFDHDPYPRNFLHRDADLERIGARDTFHSYGTGWANACNTPFRLYKHYNHEGGISTPCIVHWPHGLARNGEIERRPCHVIDLAPTLLALGKAEYPNHQSLLPLSGRSLMPLLQNQSVAERPIFFEHEGNRAVRHGAWKLVWANYRQRWELYDMRVDRSETRDLAKEMPAKVRELEQRWLEWARANFVAMEKVTPPATGMPKIYYPLERASARREPED